MESLVAYLQIAFISFFKLQNSEETQVVFFAFSGFSDSSKVFEMFSDQSLDQTYFSLIFKGSKQRREKQKRTVFCQQLESENSEITLRRTNEAWYITIILNLKQNSFDSNQWDY